MLTNVSCSVGRVDVAIDDARQNGSTSGIRYSRAAGDWHGRIFADSSDAIAHDQDGAFIYRIAAQTVDHPTADDSQNLFRSHRARPIPAIIDVRVYSTFSPTHRMNLGIRRRHEVSFHHICSVGLHGLVDGNRKLAADHTLANEIGLHRLMVVSPECDLSLDRIEFTTLERLDDWIGINAVRVGNAGKQNLRSDIMHASGF